MATTQQVALADLLKMTRAAKGLSLQKAAIELGVTEYTYSMWERGAQRPKMERAAAIVAFTGESQPTILAMLGLLTPAQLDILRAAENLKPSAKRWSKGRKRSNRYSRHTPSGQQVRALSPSQGGHERKRKAG